MSSGSDSQNNSESISSMIDCDFNSNSTSSSPVVSANSLVVDHIRESRTNSHHDYNTSGRTNEEPAVGASPFTAITGLRSVLGVPVYGEYETMVGLVERSPLLFPR